MPMTAAQYKTEFEAQLAAAEGQAQLKPESAVAHAQVGAVYAFLFAEKSHMDAADPAVTVSSAAANYATKAETALTNAKNTASGWTAKPATSVAWAQIGSTWAYAFVERVRLDNPLPTP